MRGTNGATAGSLGGAAEIAKALTAVSRTYVLAEGRIVSGGMPGRVFPQPHIRSAHLGEL